MKHGFHNTRLKIQFVHHRKHTALIYIIFTYLVLSLQETLLLRYKDKLSLLFLATDMENEDVKHARKMHSF
jgi:hypothetical protein